MTRLSPFTPVLVLLAVAALASCSREPRLPDAFVGTWKSDAELTLESVRASDKVNATARAGFEAGMFGRLVMEFRKTEGRQYFIDEGEVPPFEPHSIVDSGDEFVTFSHPELAELGLPTERTFYVDGDLLAVHIEEWGFIEYFRRVEQ